MQVPRPGPGRVAAEGGAAVLPPGVWPGLPGLRAQAGRHPLPPLEHGHGPHPAPPLLRGQRRHLLPGRARRHQPARDRAAGGSVPRVAGPRARGHVVHARVARDVQPRAPGGAAPPVGPGRHAAQPHAQVVTPVLNTHNVLKCALNLHIKSNVKTYH